MKSLQCLSLAIAATLLGSAFADEKKTSLDPAKLVGDWKITGGKKAGNDLSDMAKTGKFVFTKNEIKIMHDDKALFVIKYTVNAKATPAAIDLEITQAPDDGAKGTKSNGIIELNGDDLKICYPPFGGDRPNKFEGTGNNYLFMLERIKADKK